MFFVRMAPRIMKVYIQVDRSHAASRIERTSMQKPGDSAG
jgi:hypothetical protein